MAKFETHIAGNVGQQITGETVNVTMRDAKVTEEVPVDAKTARTLEAIVENQDAEKAGFTEELKGEVLGALKEIAREQARALPGRVYAALKEFFPSYVKPFLP